MVAAYGLILPAPVLEAPRLGCLNVHASLLPRWRGAAPIQRAILAGDRETGVTIMQMDEGLDTGPMLLQEAVPIGPTHHRRRIDRTLAALGTGLMLEALDGVGARHARRPTAAGGGRDLRGETAPRRGVARLAPARPPQLERQVRAFDPWPGAYFLGARRAHPGAARPRPRPAAAPHAPGTVLDENLSIACGEGALRPLRLQRAGRGALDAAAFLRGFALPPGTILPCPATS